MADKSEIAHLALAVRTGEARPSEHVQQAIARIEQHNPELNAFIAQPNGTTEQRVDELERRLAAEQLEELSLAGVPIAIKDNIATDGIPTTCASRILEGWVPPYDATAVTRLKAAGAVVIGKTNLDEFGMGSSTEFSHIGPTHNPHDLERVPGGSSGGSAAAVAAGLVPAALGSDTGGSVRQPASYCGVVGFKPTYGRVSRYGLVAYASSLEQIGTLTRTVEDAARILQVIAGHDACDSTSLDVPLPDYVEASRQDVAGLRIGVVRQMLGESTQPEVREAVQTAAEALSQAGASVVEVSIPSTDHALSAYYLIATAEASSNLGRYDGVRFGVRAGGENGNANAMITKTRSEGFGVEVKRRIILGTFALSAGYQDQYYGKAQRVRTLLIRDFTEALREVDVFLGPTAPTTAFKVGELIDDPQQLYLMDVCTVTANMAGLPAVSVPWTTDQNGLPIGVQLIAGPLQEPTLFRAAACLERSALAR
jgi:aspartyl-tRNA(Asn)/glutamyl-tRNA(Gln) amidotransferase subunit A